MKLIRTVIAAFLTLLGVMMIVTWGFALKSVEAIENGEAAAKLTDKVLASESFADLAADRAVQAIYDQLDAQIDAPSFDLLWGFAEQPIHDAVMSVIRSDFLAVNAQAGAERAQVALVNALSDEARPYGPLVLTIDVSDRINARIDQIPTIGGIIPDISFPSIEVEVIPADSFEDMRTAFSAAKWVATWFLWIGLAFIGLGIAVSPRRQWFLARAMLVAGVLVLAVGFTVGAVGAHTIATFMPGGAEGGLGVAVSDLLSDTAIPPIAELLITLGLFALFLAIVAALAARFIPIFRARVRERSEENQVPIVHEARVVAPAPSGSPVATSAEPPVSTAVVSGSRDDAKAASLPTSIPVSVPIAHEDTPHPMDGDGDVSENEVAVTEPMPVAQPALPKKPARASSQKKPASKRPAPTQQPASNKPAPKKPVPKKPAPKKPAQPDDE